ncbi:hypothetical protein NA57DRAFT_52771 [Rhizodiscina lignyota]|uniref:Uncharacterized protein n=1 Tax=Rhizodiscina lignyota TaxID=1504668 RepID=A0A9P4IPY6_9PEZI|nr:hypothetical protein NA57DRAFT_52771 [Rhizodiscina lignyota]
MSTAQHLAKEALHPSVLSPTSNIGRMLAIASYNPQSNADPSIIYPTRRQPALPTNVYRVFLDPTWEPPARQEMREVLRLIVDWYFRIEDSTLAFSRSETDKMLRRVIDNLKDTAEIVLQDGVRDLQVYSKNRFRSPPSRRKRTHPTTLPKLPFIHEE